MFNSGILDVAIGLITVFILVSTVCTAIREAIESQLKTRAAYCHYAICELLGDVSGTGVAQVFFKHYLIASLYKNNVVREPVRPSLFARGGDMPSYVPARSFASALIDVVAHGTGTSARPPVTFASLRVRAQSYKGNDHLRAAMLSALDASRGDLDSVREHLEHWFDTTMDRVSGWYKRSTQTILFGVAIAVVATLNIDSIAIAETLYRDQTKRAAIVALAQHINPEQLGSQAALQQLNTLQLPIGWSSALARWNAEPAAQGLGLSYHLMKTLLGLLLTAFAATLGAPFWFDLLNRVMVIRATVKPHEKSPEEPSQDRLLGSDSGSGHRASRAVSPIIQVITNDNLSNTRALPAASPNNDIDDCGEHGDDDDPTPDESLPQASGGVST